MAEKTKPMTFDMSKATETNFENLEVLTDRVHNLFPVGNLEKLLYRLSYNRFKMSDINAFNRSLLKVIDNLTIERDTFKEFLNEEFGQYTTSRNGYPNKLYSVTQQLDESLEKLKKLVDKFCKNKRRTLAKCGEYECTQSSTIGTPMFIYGAYQPDIFGPASFPEEVRAFIANIINMCALVDEIKELAHDAIEEEKAVRANANLVMALFEDFRTNFMNEISGLLDLFDLFANIPLSKILNGNDFYKATQKAPTYVSALQALYHNIHQNTVKIYILCEALNKKRQHGFTDEELRAWPDDREAILKARKVIAHIDKLVPEGTDDQKFATYVCMFCVWAGNDSIKATYECFKSRYNGEHELRSYSIVNEHKKDFSQKSAMYTQFTQAIDALLNQPENKKLWSQDKG